MMSRVGEKIKISINGLTFTAQCTEDVNGRLKWMAVENNEIFGEWDARLWDISRRNQSMES